MVDPPPLLSRRGHARWAAIVVIALFAMFSPRSAFADYKTYEIESLTITIDSDWPLTGASGYFPVRFEITNHAEAREIEITATAQHWFNPSRTGRSPSMFGGMDAGRADIRRQVRLKHGDHVKLTLPLPVFSDNENINFRIRENGKFLEGFSANVNYEGRRPLYESPVLVATPSGSPLYPLAEGWLRPRPAYGSSYFGYYAPPAPVPSTGTVIFSATPTARRPAVPRMDYILDPERLPNNWLAFTSLRAVMLGPDDWKLLDPAQQDALLAWTASGGDLLLVDGPIETVLPPGQTPVGIGAPRVLQTASAGPKPTVPYFLGNIHLLKTADIQGKGFEPTIRDLESGVAVSDWSLPAVRSRDWGWISDRGFRLPIEGVGNIPTRAYLSILGLFIIVIGPLNFIYLWRKRQQVLLVLTVPLISLTFILFVTGYGLFSEGFAVRARAVTFTVLDQNSKKAATRASVSLYTGGITPSSGVRFASDVAVFPLGTDGAGARGQMALDLTGEQRFQSGLLQARTPGNFEQIVFQPARQRLNFERNGNELSVVNGLGTTIESLYYRDGGQTYGLTKALPSGERGSMQIATLKGANLLAEPLKTISIFIGKFQQVLDRQPDGAYVAVLETSPFWDSGVAKIEETESFHFVLGYVGGQP